MSILARVSIFTKILGVMALMVMMTCGGTWYATSHMSQIDDGYSTFIDRDVQAWVASIKFNRLILQVQLLSYRMIAETKDAEMRQLVPQFDKAIADALVLTATVTKNEPAMAGKVQAIESQVKDLQQATKPLIERALASDNDKAMELMRTSINPKTDKIAADIAILRTQLDEGIQKGSKDLTATTESTIRLTWIVMLTILTVGTALAYLVVRFGITSPLRSLVNLLNRLAKGEDVEIVGADRNDEVGETARAVNGIKDVLAEKARRESEEKAERDRMAEEERQRNDAARAETARQVAEVVESLGAGLERLAKGDLTCRLNQSFAAEYKKVQDDFNAAIGQLQQTISAIVSSTREVSSAAAEISTSTTDLSQRTEEQAASLEETSASMEQISATVRKNAENANQANQLTKNTCEVANRGGDVVSQAVSAMSRIEESSRKIADIIGVIDEIARQTNLLALNAAVEAARAGEAGRGFAVVASEVRSLAQRSSQAAKDIKDLITSSSMQVQEGVDLVNRAGTSLSEIVESIKRVAEIVSDIAAASTQQSTGLDQINKALAQMDEVTQQNSALVEENAATAKTLEHQSSAMDDRVGFFRLDNVAAINAAPRVAEVAPKRAVAPTPAAGPPKQPAAVAPVRAAVAARRRAGGRAQTALATAVNDEQDWKEF